MTEPKTPLLPYTNAFLPRDPFGTMQQSSSRILSAGEVGAHGDLRDCAKRVLPAVR